MNALQPTPVHGARTDAGEWPAGWCLVEGAGFRPRQRLHLAVEMPAVPEPQAGLRGAAGERDRPGLPTGTAGFARTAVAHGMSTAATGLASDGRTRILYTGTSSHRDELQVIQPALKSIMGIRPEVESIQVEGGAMLPGTRMLTIPATRGAHPEFVGWLRAISSVATIAVAPLCDNEFNAMKSDIKALDYAFAGPPTVFRDVGLCKAVVVDGKAGLQAQNDPGNWILQMPRLLEGGGLREWIRKVSGEWALQYRGKAREHLRCITCRAFGRETGTTVR